jgi:hypothetical protein
MMKYLLSTKKCLVLKYCLIFIVLGLDTSSRCSMAGPQRGSGTSVKRRSLTVCWEGWGNSNLSKTKTIKYYALQVMHHFTPETENVDFYDLWKKNDLMAAINSLNRLNCYEEWRKYQTCRMASRFNCLIKLYQ